ncbi:urease accessory protein UreD [Paenibacillus profundus]|uniref:Urease accessory protein UreD n=1 Tax=Paenibacillus profundus TaxID=1173085 RepID=A0ABS8YK91_9BACL|nr:urease accessory protein UreD [Paenibacillus profundus]MCE5170775.1 urease accessory protein UreD [Paenibacillus profundus]
MQRWTGMLRLTAENRQGRTAAAHVYHQGAYKIARPMYPDDTGQVYYYVMNPGGGYVDGDRYLMELELGEHAQALITTQSSTKIYRTPHQPVLQLSEVALKHGSYLEWLPDPIIAYRNARYEQRTVIRMERSASLICAEIITPGWSPDGAQFAYDELALKTEIYMDEQQILFDNVKLRPHGKQMLSMGRMDGQTHLGSMFVIGEQATPEFIEQMCDEIGLDTLPGRIGLSQLIVPGFAIRMLGNSTQQMEKVFGIIINYVRQQWFGKERLALRKY